MFVSKRNLFFKSKLNGYLLFCGNSNSFFQFDDDNVACVKKMFETGDDSELPEDIKNAFIRAGVLLKESDEDFFNRMKYISYQARFNPNILSLTIAPTMACNFKCVYCYEGERVHNNVMSDEVIDGIIKFIKKGDFKTLNINWYGGEPLCAWDKITEMIARIEELKIPNVTHLLVTNGSLLDEEKIKYMIEKKFINMQITLDGDEKIHNERRPMKNGGNSYQTIMSKLDLVYNYCKEHNERLPVSIRVNVDKSNDELFQKIYTELNTKYDYFFNVYPGIVTRESEQDCHSDNCMDSLEVSSFVLNLAEKYDIATYHLYPLRNILYGCSSNVVNTFVIDSHGDLFRCWDNISNPERKVGNIVTGINDIHNISQEYVMNGTGFEEEKCKDCIFLFSCMGGCTRKRLLNKKLGKELNPVCTAIKNNPEKFLESYFYLKQKAINSTKNETTENTDIKDENK